VGWPHPFRRDLVLLHPPAIFDFRQRPVFLGPIADAVPSTPIFEMYPVGLTSLAAFLDRNHYNVEIVNLAYRMLHDPAFDAERCLARLSAPLFGIDLHWLPHAQGALRVAELLRALHPASRILVGGLSASYYHEELIRSPNVDFVLRGDSTEEPARQLLQALREGTPLGAVENLTWKDEAGGVHVNPLTFVPDTLDGVDVPAYTYMIRSLFKWGGLHNVVPCLEWLRYPITLLLTARGCMEECAICGGSRSAYARICQRTRPAFRSPEKLVEDVRAITSFSRAPIFMVHDPRMGGYPRAVRLFSLLKRLRPANEIIFELYYPADDRFFAMVAESLPAWSAEITLESPDEAMRRLNRKFPWPNAVVERTIASALAHGCRTLDLFFMIGLPHQRYADALDIPAYCDALLGRFAAGRRLRPFVAPLAPFLDPGSRAFEDPSLGYTLFCRTLDEHRAALLESGWQRILSYETDGMKRDEIVRATYDVAEQLNRVKRRHGLIDETTFAEVDFRLNVARLVLTESERQGEMTAEAHERLDRYIRLANQATMFGNDELKAPVRHRFRGGTAIAASLARGLLTEISHTVARLAGRYDVAACERRPSAQTQASLPEAGNGGSLPSR
jgi:B12-binding domain/radical SAM domain protein